MAKKPGRDRPEVSVWLNRSTAQPYYENVGGFVPAAYTDQEHAPG